MEREFSQGSNWIEFSHTFGQHEHQGDVVLDATGDIDTFQLVTSQCEGRDSDNYERWSEAEIALNEEEAFELHLMLSVWLEQCSDLGAD